MDTMKTTPLLMTRQNVINTRQGIKTQTRRVIAGNPFVVDYDIVSDYPNGETEYHGKYKVVYDGSKKHRHGTPCPYGQLGDRIAFKETWWGFGHWIDDNLGMPGKPAWRWVDETDAGHSVLYDADLAGNDVPAKIARTELGYHRRPSIYLPKIHWRTFAELTQVRVERLQDISEADCLAEGIHHAKDGAFYGVQYFIGFKTAVGAYAELWDSINGPGSFDANPYVWALTYKYLP